MKTDGMVRAFVLCTISCFVMSMSVTHSDAAEPTFDEYFEPFELAVEPNAPGYSLPLGAKAIVNYADADRTLGLADVQGLIESNGFAVVRRDLESWDPNGDSMTAPYTYLKKEGIPVFVTADTVLHLYHIQFGETLKDVEEREFVADINDLTEALFAEAVGQYEQFTDDLQEAARRNVAYLAVARQLMNPDRQVPAIVEAVVNAELAKIEAHEGFLASDLFIYEEDYSQYVPRGHYTRSEALERYFRTLMWYGRMGFLLKGSDPWGPTAEALISPYDADIQTLQAMLLARGLQDVQVGERSGLEVWDRLYRVTAFYVGLADDLTPYDYLWAIDQIFTNGYSPADLAEPANLQAIRTQLALLPSPKIFGGTGNPLVPPGAGPDYIFEILDKTKGLRFMGQRFIPDSYMFQRLVDPQVSYYMGDPAELPFTAASSGAGRIVRGFPRGLDVMALLGSKQALHVLLDEGDTDFVDYWARFGELKHEFDALSVMEWNRNLYCSWLYALKALVTPLPQGYPEFMRTDAWEKRSLHAALASWTELRHDTILYAKQSYTPPRSGRPAPPAGYVEPIPEFYGRLLALSRMTRTGLSDMNVLSVEATDRLIALEVMLEQMVEIASKQLTNERLTPEEIEFLEEFADSLEALVTGVEETGLKTTLVADVHTNGAEGLVLEEGVGKVDLIVVAYPAADGSAWLAAGPVLSYYEFKHPMDDRLTDEAWRELLDSPGAPGRPAWYQPLLEPSGLLTALPPGK